MKTDLTPLHRALFGGTPAEREQAAQRATIDAAARLKRSSSLPKRKPGTGPRIVDPRITVR